jgi:hypothetical protein
VKINKINVFKLLVVLALIFLLIEAFVLIKYFFSPTNSVHEQVMPPVPSLDIDESAKEVTPHKKDDSITIIPPDNKKEKDDDNKKENLENPEIEQVEKLDEAIANYEKLENSKSKVDYFISNLASSSKKICGKGSKNSSRYKSALIATYNDLINIIPNATSDDFTSICNIRDDLEFTMRKLNCEIDPTIQKKLRKKCLE